MFDKFFDLSVWELRQIIESAIPIWIFLVPLVIIVLGLIYLSIITGTLNKK